MEEGVQITPDDVAPMLGQYQLTIISQDKLIRSLQARIAELEEERNIQYEVGYQAGRDGGGIPVMDGVTADSG